jgi:hypothetical protein
MIILSCAPALSAVPTQRTSPDPVCPAWCTDHFTDRDVDGSTSRTHYSHPTRITVGSAGYTERLRFNLVRRDDDGQTGVRDVEAAYWSNERGRGNWVDLLNVQMDAASCRDLAGVLLGLAREIER